METNPSRLRCRAHSPMFPRQDRGGASKQTTEGSRLTAIRRSGQPDFRSRFDPVKSGGFSWYARPLVFRYRDKGGGVPEKSMGVYQPHIP